MFSLSLDEALSVLPHLPPLARSGLSIETFGRAGALEAFIVEACRHWPELYVAADGALLEQSGHGVGPETSGARFGEAFRINPGVARAADAFLKARHPVSELELLVLRAAYASGRVLGLGLRDVPVMAPMVLEVVAEEPPPFD